MNQDLIKNPIFIVGMPRSGTTLMSAILSAHPNIAIAPESHFLRYWISRYAHKDLGNPAVFDDFWEVFTSNERFAHFGVTPEAVKSSLKTKDESNLKAVFSSLLTEYAQLRDKPRWGEKTPDHYQYVDILFEWYPQARIIWMLRDPRAVAASISVVPWARSNTDRHAHTWVKSLRLMKEWALDDRVKVIQYEQLVTDTEKTLYAICDFLSEPYASEMMNHSQANRPILNQDQWEKAHLQKTLQPISAKSIDKWRSKLSLQEISVIEYITRSDMIEHGYQPLTQDLNQWRFFRFNLMRARRKMARYMGAPFQLSNR